MEEKRVIESSEKRLDSHLHFEGDARGLGIWYWLWDIGYRLQHVFFFVVSTDGMCLVYAWYVLGVWDMVWFMPYGMGCN